MAAAQCRSSKCTAERKGFRRELDSWRHKLIHCVGVESILEGIYGPMLLRDLNIFDDCEPKESDDWSVEASCSHCSFCTLPLDQLSDLPPAAASPLHSPSDYSPCQAPTLSESSQSAQQFLQAVFHKKDVPHGYDSNVPLAAQELMKKMIHKFAIEYASKSHVHMTMNGLTTDNLSPQPTPCDLDAPLDLTVPREKEEDGEPGPDAVLDLSKRTSVCSAAPVTADNKSSGRQRRQREDYVDRSWELSEGLLSKALKDVRSGRLQEQRAALLYGIPQRTLRQGLEGWAEERLELLHRLAQQSSEEADPFTPYNLTSSTLGGEACLVLQKVAAWAEKAENEGEAEEHSDYHLPAAFCSGLQKTLSLCFPQLRDTLQPPASPTPSLEAPASLRIPQVRSTSDTRSAAAAADSTGVPEKQQHHSTSFAASTTNAVNPGTAARALFKLRPPYTQDTFTGAASHSPLRLDLRRSSLDDSEECGDRRDKDKQPRKKRGRYRQYDHDLLEEAITMVMGGRMSVSKAQGVYGVPHSTLEYKVKERSGTLKNPPKKKSPIPCLFNSNSSGSGANARNAVSGTSASAAATKSLPLKEELGGPEKLMTEGGQINENSALEKVLNSLCPAHRSLISQILMLARQEQLLSLPNPRLAGQDASKCCHHSLTSQNNLPPCCFPLSNSKSLSGAPHYPLVDCAHQGCSKTLCSPAESKFSCTLRCCPLSESKASQGPCCCIESSYPVSCHENLLCTSCQHLTGHQTKNHCSSSSSPSLYPSSQVCPASSICCNSHCPVSCLCHSSHTCLAQTRQTMEKEGEDVDPPCPVLKREHSPSPPPLSPIPPDITSIAEEKPPLLPLYSHDEHLPLVDNQHLDARLQEAPSDIEDAAELNGGQTQKNSNRSLLRDVVDRFTEKLETIRPQDKDPPQLSSSTEHGIEKEGAPSSPSPQSIPFHADAHLSEIITTVLHTGSDSDYNLSELFHQHDNKEAKSPNTRARRRQEVLASLTLPANLASSRRHSLKIKRELAMLDPSYCRRKVPQAKRKLKDGSNSSSPVSSSSDTAPVKEATRESGIQENEMVQISGKLSVESGNFGDSSKEIGRMTGKTKDKVTDYTRNDGLESPVFEQRRVEVNTIKAEEDGFEVKEDIQTIIVKEEIETIEVGQNVPAIEEKASFQQTLKPPCKLQTKPCRVVSEGNYQSCAERHTIVGNHLENEENIEESDIRLTRSRGLGGRRKTIAPYPSSKSRDATRSKRNIVPPQRFSSYVTEPRKMYFVACFSENIFNPRTLVDSVGQSTTSIDSQNLDLMDPLLDSGKTPSQAAHLTKPTGAEDDLTPKVLTGSSNADQSQGFSVSSRSTRLSPSKYSSKNKTDVRDSAARPYGRLRSSSTKPHALESVTVCRTPTPKSSPSFSDVDIPPNPSELPFEFSSPIKIMYVSPVINEEGVKYCLKSAASSSGGQVVHNFDPCEQSSWAGTPETSNGTERAIFQIGSNSAPLKNATSSPKSASPSPKKVSTPLKSPSTPPLSGSPTLRSASSPTKVVSVSPKGSRRSGELTPLKRVARTENQRSPADLGSSHEITPTPKRRPGRPKKLGPRLEQKAKRPIGRPRKQTTTGPIQEGNADVVKAIEAANMEKENKNLKITVVYGRSRRNKRLVSEGQGQQELCETAQSVERNIDFRNLLHGTQEHSDVVKEASPECLKELNLVRPVNDESAPPASSNIKCQKLQGAISIRKPGRPAKVKISGISVTVTTVSPRQRKIQMDKDVKRSQETLQRRKTLLPEFNYIKETWNSDFPSRNECRHKEGKGVTKDEGKAKRLDRPVAVRHSVRVRKPSIYLLHSVATSSSRSYSHSTALIRSSRKLLLNKAINQRKLEKAQDCLENLKDNRQSLGREKNPIRQDLSQVAAVSVDSIFPPQETMKWWAASAEKKDLNQEFARRIQLVSDTWVSDIENQQKCSLKPRSGPPSKRSRCSSVVRALFDCPPNKPSSCSMQQLGSWFMQTTETKPLAIVKKASSRNPYEFMHYPRSTNNNEGVCPSPQAERLRKHIKKFAKTVPKSPLAHRLALERLRNGNKTLSAGNIKRQLFTSRFAPGRLSRTVSKYATTLSRAKARFLTCLQRNGLPKRQGKDWWPSVTAQKKRDKALSRLSPAHQALDGSEKGSADPLPKVDSLSSKAWSPEKLKECRVFLKKINSPVSESTAEEELDSCKVTLDDWSPSAYRFAGSEGGLARENEAVKTDRKAKLKAGSNSDESSSSVSKSPQEQAEVQIGQKEEQNAPVIVSTGAPQPPSVKMLRQSRVRGLSGPRWSDFVLEN